MSTRPQRDRKKSQRALEAERNELLLTPAGKQLPAYDSEEEESPAVLARACSGGGEAAHGQRRKRTAVEIEQTVALLEDVEADKHAMIAAAAAAAPMVLPHILGNSPQQLGLMAGGMPWFAPGQALPYAAASGYPVQQPVAAAGPSTGQLPRTVPIPARRRRATAAAVEQEAAAVEEVELAVDETLSQPKKRKSSKTKKIVLSEAVAEGLWVMDPAHPLIYRAPASAQGSSKVVALSLDGTICVDLWGRPYAGNATDWKYAFSGVPAQLAHLVRQGNVIAILNNQGNVKGALLGKASMNARGKVDAILSDLERHHGVDTSAIKVLLAPEQGGMRKPATGMWQFFESSCNGGVKIDLSQSFYVGSSPDDVDFAAAVGLKHVDARAFFDS